MYEKVFDVTFGVIGSIIAGFFGGWSDGIVILCMFMGIDYVSGLVVAGVFKNSPKTESGGLNSHYCWEGLAKKCMTLVFVGVAFQIDRLVGTSYIRDAVSLAFCLNELVSIVENAGLMGVPIPKQLTDAIDILKSKTEED